MQLTYLFSSVGRSSLELQTLHSPDSPNTDCQYKIRSAQPSDAVAFRMLLPVAHRPAVRLVATAAKDDLVVAAAMLTESQRSKLPVGPGAMIHVIPTHRRHGIGKALLHELMHQAAERRAAAIYAVQMVDAESDEAHGWLRLGFRPIEQVLQHEIQLAVFETRLGPLVARMHQRGRIPKQARIVPLCDVDRKAVANMHIDTLGGSYEHELQKLHGIGPNAYWQLHSKVLVAPRNGTDQLLGFLLAHRHSASTAVVDANVIDASIRGGWATMWLRLETARGVIPLGIEKLIYQTRDHYGDSRRFSEHLDGKVIHQQVLMVRPLAPGGVG